RMISPDIGQATVWSDHSLHAGTGDGEDSAIPPPCAFSNTAIPKSRYPPPQRSGAACREVHAQRKRGAPRVGHPPAGLTLTYQLSGFWLLYMCKGLIGSTVPETELCPVCSLPK